MKNAALIAKSICERSNPIASISAICAALSAPIASPPGADEPPVFPADCATPAGEGVEGTLLVVVLDDCCGAAGMAGVSATEGAGVVGTFDGVETEGEAVDCGTGFGLEKSVNVLEGESSSVYLGNHAHNKSLLLDFIGLYGVGILQDFAYCEKSVLYGRTALPRCCVFTYQSRSAFAVLVPSPSPC